LRNFIKQALLILIFLAGWVSTSISQDFLPVLSDNYMGINQVTLQPAAIADSHFERDFSLIGFNCDIYNDAMRFRSKWLLNPLSVLTQSEWWDDNTYLDAPNGKAKNFYMSQSIMGPGFMVSIGEKQALGFTFRLRNVTNTDDLTEPLFRSIYSDYKDSLYWNQWYLDKNMRSVQHVFGDYGFTYATEVLNEGPNFLKVGVTVNILQGIAAAYVQTDSLLFYYDGNSGSAENPISWNSPHVYGGLSGNWGKYDESGNYDYAINYELTSKPSVGLDIGIVYEFRPRYKQYFYNVDGNKYLVRKDRNKYFLKIGISLLDIGRLKYKKEYNSFNLAANFTADYLERYQAADNSVPDNTYWLDAQKASFSFLEYVNFVDTLYHRSLTGRGVVKDESDPGTFTVRLPAALSLQVDVKAYKRLYVNMTTYTAFYQGFSYAPNSHSMSNFSITPRYEQKWLTVSLPVQFNQYKKVNVGLGVRTAFVYGGITNLFSAIFSDRHSLNIYLGAKFPVFKGKPRSDVDNDILAF
jgi:hypothetical protein